MTTVWRPRVRIAVPNIDGAEGEVEVPEEVNKGTKRKRAPPTKGPCEHGAKYRSNCKVCSACPHGRRRHECKECGGASICEHGPKCIGALFRFVPFFVRPKSFTSWIPTSASPSSITILTRGLQTVVIPMAPHEVAGWRANYERYADEDAEGTRS